jgi:hypothetical protein
MGDPIIGYKLVDKDGYTRLGLSGETLWEIGEEVCPKGEGFRPCGPGVLHDYADPLLAAMLNPAHADIGSPRLLVVEHSREPETDGLKRWTAGPLRVLREEPMPEPTLEQRVRFAILAVLEFCDPLPEWRKWADGWLSGRDRSAQAAQAAAAKEMTAAARAAVWAAAEAPAAAKETAWTAMMAARAATECGWNLRAFGERLAELAGKAMEEEPSDATGEE